MNDYPDIDHDSPEALIDALRQEIQGFEGVDDNDVVTLPPEVLTLFWQAPVPPGIAEALDDLIAADDPISDELAARIRRGTKSIQAEHGTTLRFLEQVVTHARGGRDLAVLDVAAHIDAPSDVVDDIEGGRAAFTTLGKEQVAKWIQYLEINVDAAVEALRRSVRAPATAYGGDNHDVDQADEFVRGVELILRNEGADPPQA